MAVDDLPDEYRELICMRHYAELSYGEIAEIKEMPLGTVKNKLFRGRQMLKERLADYLDRLETLHRPTRLYPMTGSRTMTSHAFAFEADELEFEPLHSRSLSKRTSVALREGLLLHVMDSLPEAAGEEQVAAMLAVAPIELREGFTEQVMDGATGSRGRRADRQRCWPCEPIEVREGFVDQRDVRAARGCR